MVAPFAAATAPQNLSDALLSGRGRVRLGEKRPPSFSLSEHVSVPDDHVAIGEVTEFVELAILTMDVIHGTDFHGWVRDENMVPGICERLLPLISEFEDGPPHVVARGVTWITQEWRASSVAELLVKLFFHWGLDEQRFADLTRQVIKDRPPSFASELVAFLVVGERARHAAAFVRRLTGPWPAEDVVELVDDVCRRLNWGTRYFRRFVLHYAKTSGDGERTPAALAEFIAFVAPRAAADDDEDERRRGAEIQRCASAFEACVREAKEGPRPSSETPGDPTAPSGGGGGSKSRKAVDR